MNIDEKDIIVLSDDNHYIVVKKATIDNINYYYISDINNKENIKFLYEDGNELVEIENKNTFDNVLEKMFNDIDLDDFLRELKERLEQKNINDTNI